MEVRLTRLHNEYFSRVITYMPLYMRRQEKPTRCHWMFYCTYNMFQVSGTFMPIIRSSRLYVCYYRLWCAVLGCSWSEVRCSAAGCRHLVGFSSVRICKDARTNTHQCHCVFQNLLLWILCVCTLNEIERIGAWSRRLLAVAGVSGVIGLCLRRGAGVTVLSRLLKVTP